MMNRHFQVKQVFAYTFKENIDIVYKCFFSPFILTAAGINGSFFDLSIINGIDLDEPGCEFTLDWKNSPSFETGIVVTERKLKDQIKKVTHKVKEINGNPIDSNLFIKYNFYRNTSDNSTFVSFEVYFDSFDDPYSIELSKRIKEEEWSNANKVEIYLRMSKKEVKNVESIVINRPIVQVWDYLSNIEMLLASMYHKNSEVLLIKESGKQKKNGSRRFLVKNKINNLEVYYLFTKAEIEKNKVIITYEKEIRESETKFSKHIEIVSISILSQVSCFVSIESSSTNNINGKYLNALSCLYQNFLKKVKKDLESMTCYFD